VVELVISAFFEDPDLFHWAHLSTSYVSLRILGSSELGREDLDFDTSASGAFFVICIVYSSVKVLLEKLGLNNFDEVLGVVDINVTPDTEIVELLHELLNDSKLAYVFLAVGFEGS